MKTSSKKEENDKTNLSSENSSIISKISRFKKLNITIGSILIFIFGFFCRPPIEKYIEFVTHKRLTQKKLCYEIFQANKYKKDELVKLSEKLGYDKFNLNLDDPILENYYLIQIKLRNKGEFLHGPIKFNLSCDNNYTKIIDIKHKVKKPANKVINITHNLPSLNWKISEGAVPKIFWGADGSLSRTAGFNIYRSLDREVGFGVINDKLITEMKYNLPIDPSQNLSKNYFRISAKGVNGVESSMSDQVIITPEIFAFTPFFKEVYWISPKTKLGAEPNGSMEKPFRSLKEAISKSNKFAIFIVKQYRKDIISSQNVSKEANVFYKDDLSFLNGKIEFSILDGIDENAEIDLSFLCKIFELNNFFVKLKLIGSPEVIFEKIKRKEIKKSNLQPDTKTKKNLKVFLTPKIVKTYLGYNTIFLAWKIPESNEYNGVRIFRSVKRDLSDFEKLGEEVYDGLGSYDETLNCEYHQRDSIDQDFDALIPKKIRFKDRPPRRKTGLEGLAPAVPTMGEINVVYEFKVKSPFFEDKNVKPGTVYTYTLFAYDVNNNYSYPITVNASLEDWSPKQNCMRSVR